MANETPQPPARAPLPDIWWRLSLRTRRSIASGLAVGLGAVLVIASASFVFDADDAQIDPTQFVAALPQLRVELWDTLAQCESGGDWNADTGNGYFGGLQFTQSSWSEVGGSGSPALASRNEQIMRAEFLHDRQGWDAWPACSDQLGLP